MCSILRLFVDWELQNGCEKNDISRLKTLYRILQVGNLENLAKIKLLGSFCRTLTWNEVSKLLINTQTHKVSTVSLVLMRAKR